MVKETERIKGGKIHGVCWNLLNYIAYSYCSTSKYTSIRNNSEWIKQKQVRMKLTGQRKPINEAQILDWTVLSLLQIRILRRDGRELVGEMVRRVLPLQSSVSSSSVMVSKAGERDGLFGRTNRVGDLSKIWSFSAIVSQLISQREVCSESKWRDGWRWGGLGEWSCSL